MPNSELEHRIAMWIDGRISESDSQLLQQQLRDSAEARALFRKYSRLDAAMHQWAGDDFASVVNPPNRQTEGSRNRNRGGHGSPSWIQLAIAAMLLILVGGIAFQLGRNDPPIPNVAAGGGNQVENPESEQTIAGHATLRRVANITWRENARSFHEGDVLPGGLFELDSGVVEIDFFCGATVLVEGPATIDLESDWSIRLLAGRLRANVPPAARGFIVKAADSEIIDLGTEFALEVGPENIHVQVIDGEVKLRGGTHNGEHLSTGQGQALKGSNPRGDVFKDLATLGDVKRSHEAGQQQTFAAWKLYSQELRTDNRLVAYYPISDSTADRSVPNAAATGNELDGKLVGWVDLAEGRFGSSSKSLGFRRPGSRIRARIDGQFQAFTFACWVKIDSLDNLYNALFMADGYENGEPHWQLHRDGRMMFSIMIDDTPGAGSGPAPDSRLNWVYFTPPVWNPSMSGQWMHVAATYDPVAKTVNQYFNGQQISSEPISPTYFTDRLRIGAAEIGNWGQPFRNSSEFAVRNLNGMIDELAIFESALTPDEIKTQFQQGKPFGY